MTFLYPLGLLGLIGIPILIIIYIIKSKYMEQTVSSTYLWTLSEKFIKRKNPISKLAGIISLILQILIVALISFLIARPTVVIPNSANEYCFILDASGSMNMKDGEKSRFELGKEQIAKVIDESTNGSIYSLIYVGDTTSAIFEKTEDKELANKLLSELQPVYDDTDTKDALRIAQGYFNDNPGVITYLVTDKTYRLTENIQITNVYGNEKNYAIKEATYTLVGGELSVVGTAVSYTGPEPLTIKLIIDGEEKMAAGYIVGEKPTRFNLKAKNVSAVSEVKVIIEESDSLPYDNEYIIFNEKSESSYKTLLVSDKPRFIQAAVESFLDTKIDVIGSEEYLSNPISGYGLYIFDSFELKKLPNDGTVWLINISGTVENAGFSYQGQQELEAGMKMELSKSTASMAEKLTAGIIGEDLYISKEFAKYSVYRNFTSIFTYKGNPLLFAGTNDLGNRQVVFSFDLGNTNLPMEAGEFLIIIRNLMEYSFPNIIDENVYHCGDQVDINVVANCDSIRIETPLNNVTYLDAGNAVATLKLTEVGVYKVIMQVGDTQREVHLYSAMNENERIPLPFDEEFRIIGEAKSGGFDGKYDPTLILFIILAVLFIADWVVYCYEKCRLR